MLLKITPVRDQVGQMMGRLGASLFVQLVPEGSMVNIGVGFPEEVARLLVEHGFEHDFIFTTDTGTAKMIPENIVTGKSFKLKADLESLI